MIAGNQKLENLNSNNPQSNQRAWQQIEGQKFMTGAINNIGRQGQLFGSAEFQENQVPQSHQNAQQNYMYNSNLYLHNYHPQFIKPQNTIHQYYPSNQIHSSTPQPQSMIFQNSNFFNFPQQFPNINNNNNNNNGNFLETKIFLPNQSNQCGQYPNPLTTQQPQIINQNNSTNNNLNLPNINDFSKQFNLPIISFDMPYFSMMNYYQSPLFNISNPIVNMIVPNGSAIGYVPYPPVENSIN